MLCGVVETVFIFYGYKNLDCLLKHTSNPFCNSARKICKLLKPSPAKLDRFVCAVLQHAGVKVHFKQNHFNNVITNVYLVITKNGVLI